MRSEIFLSMQLSHWITGFTIITGLLSLLLYLPNIETASAKPLLTCFSFLILTSLILLDYLGYLLYMFPGLRIFLHPVPSSVYLSHLMCYLILDVLFPPRSQKYSKISVWERAINFLKFANVLIFLSKIIATAWCILVLPGRDSGLFSVFSSTKLTTFLILVCTLVSSVVIIMQLVDWFKTDGFKAKSFNFLKIAITFYIASCFSIVVKLIGVLDINIRVFEVFFYGFSVVVVLFLALFFHDQIRSISKINLYAHRKTLFMERNVTVVFIDVVGYTEKTRSSNKGEIYRFLQYFVSKVNELAKNTGGLLTQFSGAGVMLIYHTEKSLEIDEEEPARIATNCFAAIKCAAQFFVDLEKETSAWKVRCGIASGVCHAGTMNFKNYSIFTAIGDVVNLASRLESYALIDGEPTISICKNTKDVINMTDIDFKEYTFDDKNKLKHTGYLVKKSDISLLAELPLRRKG